MCHLTKSGKNWKLSYIPLKDLFETVNLELEKIHRLFKANKLTLEAVT